MKVAGLPEVARWVLSHGSGAKALAPRELVDLVAGDLRVAGRHYSTKTSGNRR
jgi:hypothetical protein